MKGPVRLRCRAALSSSDWASRHSGAIFARVLAVLAAALASQDCVCMSMVYMYFLSVSVLVELEDGAYILTKTEEFVWVFTLRLSGQQCRLRCLTTGRSVSGIAVNGCPAERHSCEESLVALVQCVSSIVPIDRLCVR